MSSTQQEFLFFDTIIHDGEIEQVLRVDEIKFDQPVYIDEIRILPSGYNVNSLERSASRIGATKPMPCELEFFGKNLNTRSMRDRVRYRRLGKKVFHDENDMVYCIRVSIPTDSMIIKGKYEVLTIAVVGVLARPKSPAPRHDASSNNKQIVDFLQSAIPSQRAHPMDTLPLAIAPPSNASQSAFAGQQHAHGSSMIDNTPSSSSNAHCDGVWVAPPEQQIRQQSQVTSSFSHLQPQRPTPNFGNQSQARVNDEHMHEHNPSTRSDDQQQAPVRSQPPPIFGSRPQPRTNFSPSDYPHNEENGDKTSRILSYHPADDINPLPIPTNVSIPIPPFPHLAPQHQQFNQIPKKDDDHVFVRPSSINDISRRSQDLSANNGNILQQQTSTNADSYMSDDNTSESETSSVHGLSFTEDEYQAFKRDALYNTRSTTRFTTLKTYHSPIKTQYEIECEKAHHNTYRQANEELILHFRKILSHVSIDHCDPSLLESLETICTTLPIALACLDSSEDLASAIERLSDWTLKLLNIDYILEKQFVNIKDTLLKVRLIKCGIRLCGHLSLLTEDVSNNWIKNDIQSKLLNLFDSPLISPSVKYLILKTLDQTIFFKTGLLWFIGKHPDLPKENFVSPYFRLIKKLQIESEVKHSIALINRLIRKIHLNEELFAFQNQIKFLSNKDLSCLTNEQIEIFDKVHSTLSTIRDVLINNSDLISQEKSSRLSPFQSILPIIFSKQPNDENSWPIILRFMIDNEFFQSLTILIHLSILNQKYEIFYLIEDIFRELFNSLDALIYLFNQTTIHNHLFKAFYLAKTKFNSGNHDPIGSQLMCAFQTLNSLDELKFLSSNKTIEIDNHHVLEVLHCLLSLILFHHYIRKLSNKRRIIVQVLSMDKNFQILLDLFDNHDEETLKTSIQMKYLSKILYEIFVTPDSILLLEKYGVRLYELCEKFSTSRLLRLKSSFSPLLKLKSFEAIDETAEILMKEFEIHVNESINSGEFSPSLVTILCLIQYFSISPENQFALGAKIQLKYDYLLLKFYHQGIYSLLITLLQKSADALLRPWQIGLTINFHDRLILYGVIQPCLILLKTLLQKLVLDRKTKFVDLTPINALFSIYTVTLCASPSTVATDVENVRTNIIDSFLVYSWSNETDNQQTHVENCAWTKVIQEILRLINLYPYSIPCGLCLLTELLPIPLPHTVRQPLSEQEVQMIRDDLSRYYAVMYFISTRDSSHQFEKLLQSLIHTSNSIMQEILRRLFMQLIDLGPKLAKYLLKLVMDALVSSWRIEHNESLKGLKSSNNDFGRLVAFLASLIATRSGKCAVLSLLNSSDDKYSKLFKDMFQFINLRAESNETCLCQEAIMLIIQNLCDGNLCLSKSSENNLENLGNALPNDEMLSLILTNLCRLLSGTKNQQTWTQTTMAIRTMISLAEHDYGLQKIQANLMENKDVFCTLIADFDLRFDKEQPDYLEAVSALMILFQRMILTESPSDSSFTRTQTFSIPFFRELLDISTTNESQLEKFVDLINAVVHDDSSGTHENDVKQTSNLSTESLEQNEDLQTLQKIFERANNLIQILKSDVIDERSQLSRIDLPKFQSIESQFEHRLIYTIVSDYTDDRRSSSLYWFGIPPTSLIDDVDYVQDETTNPDEINDKIKCDLEDFIGKYCGTFNFFDEYQKEIVEKINKKRKSSSKKRTVTVEPASNIDTSIITTSMFKGRTPWSAPMRGNNRRNVRPGGNVAPTNAANGNLQRRIDHFRNRPLNTSRPPSMHVDEYEKQFNNENSNVNNSSTTNNNNNDNNSNNVNNDTDLLPNIQSNTDAPSERDHWPRRGVPPHFRSNSASSYRHSFPASNLGYPIGGFGLRERLPYGYTPSRYPPYDMDFPPTYFPVDEYSDDHPYDYYPMNLPFDPNRYRSHFGRYDPSGFR